MEDYELTWIELDYWQDRRVMQLLAFVRELQQEKSELLSERGERYSEVRRKAAQEAQARRRKGVKGRRRIDEDVYLKHRVTALWKKLGNYSAVARQLTERDGGGRKWSAQTVKNIVLRLTGEQTERREVPPPGSTTEPPNT